MYAQVEKSKENKSQAVASEVTQKQRDVESTSLFVDNRPEAITQRKLQELANNSPQVQQAAQFQAMADNYSERQPHPIQKNDNNTRLLDDLKSGIENLSSYSMDGVKIHYNSEKPAQLQGHAYAQRVAQKKNLQKMSFNFSASESILNKENDTRLHDNNLGVKGDCLKTGIENNSESAVIQPKLYVIGEMHQDTDLRLEQEKEFCEKEFGAAFYLEYEYNLPGTQIAADSRALKGMREATIPFYDTSDFLDRSDNMSAKELDDEAEFISDYIDKARYEFEELESNPDERFPFEDKRLKTIMPKLEALDIAFEGLRIKLDPQDTEPGEGLKKRELINVIKEKHGDLRKSILVIHKITISHGKRMKRELDKSRSTGMANALIATGEEEQGVWKVGNHHIPKIREVIEKEEKQLLGQVISENEFNDVFLRWFKLNHKNKYDAYINKRADMLDR